MSDQPTPPAQAGELEPKEAAALLERHHQFPCNFMFKVIGPGTPAFEARVMGAAEKVLGPLLETDTVRVRPSSKGKYWAITLEVQVKTAEQVLKVYDSLRGLEGLVALV